MLELFKINIIFKYLKYHRYLNIQLTPLEKSVVAGRQTIWWSIMNSYLSNKMYYKNEEENEVGMCHWMDVVESNMR